MKTENLLIGAAIAAGVYLLLKNGSAKAQPAPAATTSNGQRKPPNTSGLQATFDWLAKGLANSTPIKWTPGNAIGNYTGMSHEDALKQAVIDYTAPFISPWTTGYGVMR